MRSPGPRPGAQRSMPRCTCGERYARTVRRGKSGEDPDRMPRRGPVLARCESPLPAAPPPEWLCRGTEQPQPEVRLGKRLLIRAGVSPPSTPVSLSSTWTARDHVLIGRQPVNRTRGRPADPSVTPLSERTTCSLVLTLVAFIRHAARDGGTGIGKGRGQPLASDAGWLSRARLERGCPSCSPPCGRQRS
jgi:hypothetical protein